MNGAPGGKPDALLLDEMFSPAIAVDLIPRGIDCRAVVADALLRPSRTWRCSIRGCWKAGSS
ncbi:MAG TPA: hypothetical protein VIZ43_14170 [Trebonia sp.]